MGAKIKKRVFDWIVRTLSLFIPQKKRIYFESKPPFSDNTYCVYQKLLEEGINNEYEFVWIYDDFDQYNQSNIPENLPSNVNICFFKRNTKLYKIKKQIHLLSGKAYITCNTFYAGLRKNQFNLYLNHGAPLKKCDDLDIDLEGCDVEIALSSEMLSVTAVDSKIDIERLYPCGFPRNDYFYNTDRNSIIHRFGLDQYDKTVIWMPTFRKRWHSDSSETKVEYPYGIPLISSLEDLSRLNECLKLLNYYLIIKVHFAEDHHTVTTQDFSNIGYYDNACLERKDVQLNELLASTDALLTDYSSVYFDYLLADKPIGLIVYDLNEYAEQPGLQYENYYDAIKGTYIYTIDQLINFFKTDVTNTDLSALYDAKNRYHEFFDGKSTERVTKLVVDRLKGVPFRNNGKGT